ncbi:hypothetical protein [Aquitalea magnusonii]|uniref:hypothetical protein n=1 Tax=Aquitalea magnusonii TaxID=332411 RepID=UPI000B5C9C49|nr:hypothetical protein [Aquitalea magnusonii]
MRHSEEQTAALLALMLHRSGKTRGRVSKGKFLKVAGRKHIRGAFREQVRLCLDDLGIIMFETESGGIAMVAASALDGAPVLMVASVADELHRVIDGDADVMTDIYEELGVNEGEEDENEQV